MTVDLTLRALRRWTVALLTGTALLGLASVVVHFTARRTAWHDLYSYFSLSGEFNLPAYWNAALLGLVSAAAVASGLLTPRGAGRWGWFVVGAAALFMSVDEATQIHERTAALVTVNPLPTYAWVVFAVPLAAALVLLMTLATRAVEPALRRRLALALVLYLLGALVLEALSGYFWRQLRPNVSELFATGEEMLEMTACILAVHVMVAAWLPMRISPRQVEVGRGQVTGDPGREPTVQGLSSR